MPKAKSTEILNSAKTYYLNGDYETAKNEILEGKPHLDSGLFHYNLGSIYLKMGQFGPARFHLEKAKVEGFSYPMLWKNLDYVKAQPQVLDPAKSKNYQEVLVGKVMDMPFEMFVGFSLLILATLLYLLRKNSIKLASFTVALLVVGIFPLLGKYLIDHGYDYAIALKPSRVYEGPSKIYPDYGELGAGSRVIVSKYHDNWFFIISPKDLSGWVDKSNLGFY